MPKECKRLAEVDFPIAESSARATRPAMGIPTARLESRVVHALLGSYAVGFVCRLKYEF